MKSKINIVYKILYLSILTTSISYATTTTTPADYKWACFGYGDAATYGNQLYLEGKKDESSGYCLNDTTTNPSSTNKGCLVNCVQQSDRSKVTVQQGTILGQPKYVLKPNAETMGVTFYECKYNSCIHTERAGSVVSCTECQTASLVKRPTGGGGGGATPDPTPSTPATNLIVEEYSFLGTHPQNIIYTKTSNSSINVRIYNTSNTGSLGSGLDAASCILSNNGSVVASGDATWSISGGGSYTWSKTVAMSGTYTLKCTGVDKSANIITSPDIVFATVPYSYNMNAILQVGSTNFTMNGGNVISNGSTKQITLSGNSPVVQLNVSNLKVQLAGTANTATAAVDTGVSSSITTKNFENTVNGWASASSGTNICQAAPPTPTQTDVKVESGRFSNSAGEVDFSDVYEGSITVQYYDKNTTDIINNEKANGRCSGSGVSNGQCPYPPIFEYTFPYLVVPYNFSLSIESQTGNPIKVLYYGQGNNPATENPSLLKVIAEDNSNNPLKNYIAGCAAKNIDLELTATSSDVSLTFINPADTTTTTTTNVTTINASDFTTNSTAAISRVLAVKKKDGTPFSPSEVAEPSYLTSFDKLIYFTGKKDDVNYPQYNNPRFTSISDMVILRGRINAIDTDNAANYAVMPTTRVNYEFYCKTCKLDNVKTITGATKYEASPTLPGWWIDNTFSDFNPTEIKTDNISTTINLKASSVSNVKDGTQDISYSKANAGKYQVKINQNGTANAFPSFLLFNPYYDSNITNWGTSSLVTIYGEVQDDTRDFGLDTGDSKNTRSGGRIGGF
ncbi:hypothetical protein CCY99_00195 [Helicobacter sp. 16-1353]|uniref:hypothetical protein n=1 Tax=Helicobacter sp. 16-1353 TaxID=2004996 RepID=UPI000DCBCE13|nr:hypothetical protein [Helicobacter sp. 16-1353]RAX55155.1 hypothetical protein CCY99_00195 [Helicobacter sp. 16-1353]